MGKFSPTKLHGDCEEIANPSTAYGRRRSNWIDAHGAVPPSQVVDASCGNQRCIALRHAYLRPRESSSRASTARSPTAFTGSRSVTTSTSRASGRTRGAATDFVPACTPLRGSTRSRCAGCRTEACASRESACGIGQKAKTLDR